MNAVSFRLLSIYKASLLGCLSLLKKHHMELFRIICRIIHYRLEIVRLTLENRLIDAIDIYEGNNH